MSAFDDSGISPKEYESNEEGKVKGVIIKGKNISNNSLQDSSYKNKIAALFFSVISLVLSCLVIILFSSSNLKIIYLGNRSVGNLLIVAGILIMISSIVSVITGIIGVGRRKNKLIKTAIIITLISLLLFIVNLILRIFINI